MSTHQRGFTLVEIMIAVAVIAIIAAISIPNLLRAKISANEGAIKNDMSVFSSTVESYRAAQRPHLYPASIPELTGATPSYLDTSWNNAAEARGRHGYTLSYMQRNGGSGFTLLATPIPEQANNYFCLDQTGTLLGGLSSITASDAGCSGGSPIA